MEEPNKQPLVSICCVAYNHEPYIGQCLEGFVIQETNFPFEVLVHDDASTDGTADIIREYERTYPDIFKCYYQSENQFLKQNVLVKILFANARGKYRALCEGDDYWIDPEKLQRQVDLLETRPEYAFVYHKVNTELMSLETRDYSYPEIEGDTLTIEEAVIKHYIPTTSLLFRTSMLNLEDWFAAKNSLISGDIVMSISLLMQGDGFFMRRVMGTYRRYDKSWTQKEWSKNQLNALRNYTFIFENLDKDSRGRFRHLFKKRILPHRNGIMIMSLKKGDIKTAFQSLFVILKYDPFYFFKRLTARLSGGE